MIFSYLPKRLFLLSLFALAFLSPKLANAQCPGGKAPNRDGSCGEKPPEPKPAAPTQKPPERQKPQRSSAPSTCSITVRVAKQGGEPVANVNLILDDGESNGVTDAAGTYKFTKLACKRSYKIVPAHPDFTFNLASVTVTNLPKNGAASFIASTRDKIAKVDDTPPCNSQTKPIPRIKFDEPVTGRLNPLSAWCDEKTKGYYYSYEIDGALGGDIVQYDLQSEQPRDLLLQVVDQNGSPLEIRPDAEADDAAARQLTLPKAGEYFLRISEKSNKPVDYRLTLTRKGLSDEGYSGQLERAYAAIAEPGRPTFYSSLQYHLDQIKPFNDGKDSERKINDAIAILERLRELVPNKPDALSMLAAIYLYYRKDQVAARELYLKALDLGGEAKFRVNFGEKLEREQRRVTDNNFPCWLTIKKGKVSCEGFKPNENEVFTSNPQWVAKKPLDIPSFYFGLTINGMGKKANKRNSGENFELGTYYFVPLSALDLNAAFPLKEVTLIKGFIKDYVELKVEIKK